MRPRTKQATTALILALLAVLLVVSCTRGSNIQDATNGWSPVAALPLPSDTGGRIDAGRTVDPLDNTLTVTNPADFAVGQVLQIDDERIQITGIRDKDLTVVRGFDNTTPRPHADQSSIYTIGQQFVVFVSTKQGEIKALDDDGLGVPRLKLTQPQGEGQR